MNLTYTILAIIVIIGLLLFAVNYKGKNRVIVNHIPYPTWAVTLKYVALVFGVSCFIFAAVLASKPKTTSTVVCVYQQK